MRNGNMKSQKECYEALIAKKTLVSYGGSVEVRMLENGRLVDKHDHPFKVAFDTPEIWTIKKEPAPPKKLYAYSTPKSFFIQHSKSP